MSRLLPDRVSAGLFPGLCWLGPSGARQPFVHQEDVAPDPAAMLTRLGAMLKDRVAVLKKGALLTLMVSDSVGAIAAMPWQDQLATDREIEAYALACFDRLGLSIDERWIVHAGLRAFRGIGLAHALPGEWLKELEALLAAHDLRLERVLPVSAFAYWRQRHVSLAGTGVLVLREPHRNTALVVGRSGLLAIDVEATAGSVETSIRRLLCRVSAHHAAIAHVRCWSYDSDDSAQLAAAIAASLPDLEIRSLARAAWMKS